MNKETITEKYALCMLKEKKNLQGRELTPYLIVSMIIEMMLDENLEITDKNKVILIDKMPTANYNEKLYEIIGDMKKDEIPLKNILTSICYGFSTKNLKELINILKDDMLKDNLITLENKKGLIGSKEVVKIDENKFTYVINEIKTELLEKGNLTDDIILLASLLNSTKFLKNIFNKYEKEKLESRLKEIKDTEIAKKIKIAQAVISNMSAIITATMISATGPV